MADAVADARLASVLRLLLNEYDIYDVDALAANVGGIQGDTLAAWLRSDDIRARAAAYAGTAVASSTVDVGTQTTASTAEASTATDGTGRRAASCTAKPTVASHGAQTARCLYGASTASQTSGCAVVDAETSMATTTMVDAAVGTGDCEYEHDILGGWRGLGKHGHADDAARVATGSPFTGSASTSFAAIFFATTASSTASPSFTPNALDAADPSAIRCASTGVCSIPD